MIQLVSLIMPDIRPPSSDIRRLLMVFDTVFSLAPIAMEKAVNQPLLEKKGYHVRYTPDLLKQDGKRLAALVKDVRHHGEEFRAAVLTARAVGRDEHGEERTAGGIARLLSGGSPTANSAAGEEKEREELFVAAFLLELDAIMREEAEAVREGLHAVARKKKELFHALRGDVEDGDQEAFTVSSNASENASPAREWVIRRWLRLFAASSLPCPQPIFACTDRSVFAYLRNRHEEVYGQPPRLLFSLGMPPSENKPDEEFLSFRSRFKEENRDLFDRMGNILGAVQGGALDAPPAQTDMARLQEDWNGRVETSRPSEGRMTFYVLSRPTPSRLPVADAVSRGIPSREQGFMPGIVITLE